MKQPQGRFIEFLNDRKEEFQRVFDVIHLAPLPAVPKSASVSRYAVIKPKTRWCQCPGGPARLRRKLRPWKGGQRPDRPEHRFKHHPT